MLLNKPTQEYDLIIVGGGAAGFFASIICAELKPGIKIVILERGKDVLQKVRISGGGRCNVTNACFDPKELVKNYPRGEKELLGPFHVFNCIDTIEWFKNKGVILKTEADGRMFPITDNSETIAQCLIQSSLKAGVRILTSHRVDSISRNTNNWEVSTNNGIFNSKAIFLGTGSSDAVWHIMSNLGHQIIPAVPSLFTFNIKDPVLHNLAGITVQNVSASVNLDGVKKDKLTATGPILITHWGLSGPAILKLSAWGARILNEHNYKFELSINWLYPSTSNNVIEQINLFKSGIWAKKKVNSHSPFTQIPIRLWKYFTEKTLQNDIEKNWADLNKKEINLLSEVLTSSIFKVNGKSTFKEEFVTAGGVSLKDVNLKTFESKITPGLFFAGEILDIDAITGGFNFQAAWTGGYLAGTAIANSIYNEV